MPMRSSSLANNPLAITRELDGRYDVVLQVRDNLDLIEQVAGIDFATILAELESAQDFTGITVVQGETVAWDAVNKILTVPKGDKGDKGDTGLTGPQGAQGIRGPQGIKGNTGLKGDTGLQGPKGFDGAVGAQGLKGDTGDDLTITQITYNGNGTFNWLFSDGTTYVTPDLKGPKGDTGSQGIKGDQGISVHHLKGTSTTNPNGDFGTSPFRDTYTFYGDADETLNLGWFVVTNGISDGMSTSVYDTDGNGIVDNSERLGGELPSHYVNVTTDQTIAGNKTFTDDVVIQGDLVVSGNVVSVDVETVTVKDNLIVLNSGEVGAGVTAGEAGIVVDRGTELDYKFVFDEVSDSFKVGQEDSLQKVATREDTPVDGGVAIWDAANVRFETTNNPAVDSVIVGGHAISWNTDEGTLDLGLGDAVLQIGQEFFLKVRNASGATIDNGTVVMASGSIGNSGRITVVPHDGTQANASRALGVMTHTIANGVDGLATIIGKVREINTTGSLVGETWVDGNILYVKPDDSGKLTNIEPSDLQISMKVAMVIKAHTSGTLYVRVTGFDENHFKAWTQSRLDLKANLASPTFSGIVSAPTFSGSLNGNASTATALETSRNITLSGDVTGTTSFNGSADASIVVSVADNSHAHTIANVTGLQSTLDAKVDDSEKGAANGVATLDVNGKVVLTQIPDSVLGQLEYQSVWDFTTLPTSTQKGQYWIASVSGNGYEVGDWAVWNGVSFDKVDNTDAVATVAGRTGNVVLTKSDVGLSSVDNTSDANKPISSVTQTALNAKQATIVDGGLSVNKLDIDGAIDIGANLADTDLLIVDDGANGTNRKSAMSRLWDYVKTKADVSYFRLSPPEPGGTRLYLAKVETDNSLRIGSYELGWVNDLLLSATNLYYKGKKVWTEDNDGSGSGLDADLLDGLDSSEFMRKSTNNTITQNIIFNNGTTGTNGLDFISNVADKNMSIDMYNGTFRIYRNGGSQGGLVPFNIGVDNNLYSDNGTNGNGRILTTTTPIGYTSGMGVGGIVYQDTSKATDVTLNKLCGDIILSNSMLSAGETVYFKLINSFIGVGDMVNVTFVAAGINNTVYNIFNNPEVNGGYAYIVIKNASLFNLADPLRLRFNIRKGAIS